MTPRYDPNDGLSQLTELMRDERVIETRRESEPVEPEVRRRRGRRRLVTGGIVTVLVLAFAASYVGWALNAPVGTADAVAEVPDAAPGPAAEIRLSPEGASAISVAGADDYLGPDASGIWASEGGSKPRPIASLTKLITAMVVLSAKPLKNADSEGPTITFGKADHALYDKYYVLGATIASMPTGISMSEHDALETMLVPSASNYAEAVAGWAFGSQSGFIAAAKAWLKDKGLTHTTIVEPTGIDGRNTSTPGDLIKLAKLAMDKPAIAQIVAMPRLDVEGLPAMPNTNDLLGSSGIVGLKTGTLKESGSDLLFSANLDVGTPDPVTVTGVVLGGFTHSSVNADVSDLLASIAEGFHDVPVSQEGLEVGTYSTPWGETAHMVLGESASVFTWSDTAITAEMQTTTLTTGAKGEQVGSVTWTAGPNSVTVPVVLDGTINPPSQWWRLTHPFELAG